jgi:uncharacterized MnhB-related membrane protein
MSLLRELEFIRQLAEGIFAVALAAILVCSLLSRHRGAAKVAITRAALGSGLTSAALAKNVRKILLTR